MNHFSDTTEDIKYHKPQQGHFKLSAKQHTHFESLWNILGLLQ